jgi:uncharacterized protein (TIGR03083 family)
MSTLDVRELDRRAVALVTDVVERVRDGDLGRPTPCEGWTVRDLLRHMAAQHRGFAAAARGQGDVAESWAPPAGSDTDPVEAHQSAAADVVVAFAAADLDAAELTLPDFGGRAFPARQAMSFHAIDYPRPRLGRRRVDRRAGPSRRRPAAGGSRHHPGGPGRRRTDSSRCGLRPGPRRW